MKKRAGHSEAAAQEAEEQAALREHEEAVVRKLVDNQMALSEADRDQILQQHEQDMVKLENRYSGILCSSGDMHVLCWNCIG